MEDKVAAFEYLLYKLLEWNGNSSKNNDNNDLSILKVLKLTFFVSAVGTNKDSKETLLDDTFNNYVAMPYGHVESDVYSNIKQQKLVNVKIDNKSSMLLNSFDISSYDPKLKKRIDASIDSLMRINYKLIKTTSFDLVDLSHSWYSWQKYFNKAKSTGVYSKPIPTQVIKQEDKIYQL